MHICFGKKRLSLNVTGFWLTKETSVGKWVIMWIILRLSLWIWRFIQYSSVLDLNCEIGLSGILGMDFMPVKGSQEDMK